MLRIILSALFLFWASGSFAQDKERLAIKEHINKLSANNMEGRGYVRKGSEKAAIYLQSKFEEYQLYPINPDSTFIQFYNFQVNTFPDAMGLAVKGKPYLAGQDFIVDASSSSCSINNAKVVTVNLNKVDDSTDWAKTKTGFKSGKIYYLKNTDSFCKRMSIPPRQLASLLPDGCYMIPVYGKMTWTVGTDTIPATVLYVQDSVMPRSIKKASINVHSVLQKNYRNANLVGYVPGTVRDSFIVFTAHYDHLGRMGPAIFPGASDNASGTGMMLHLAEYFSKHPQKYSIAFIAFSGEEAGLKGSDYFVKNPLIPLANIKFLTNVDIMGDARDGITVVNATEYPGQFQLLQDINKEKRYLPEIKSRGKAKNSDHYHFTEAGVPSIFIYANGGKGYYHDIFDNAPELTMTNVAGVYKLLIDFAAALNGK
jgi:aminopeptidase YwaD